MYGVSLPYSWLRDGGTLFGEEAVPGARSGFFRRLRAWGAECVEIRVVKRKSNPANVLKIARELWDNGLRISVHGEIKRADSAVRDVFGPLSEVLENIPRSRQGVINVTVHAVDGTGEDGSADRLEENVRMLNALADHILQNHLPVSIALENSRKMPDKTEGDSVALVTAAVSAVRTRLKAEGHYIPLHRTGFNPVIGTCFDMGHYAWYREQAAPDAPYEPPCKEFLSYTIHTHIHALDPGSHTHFPLTAENHLPLVENINALGKNYAGILNLELGFARFENLMTPGDAVRESLAKLDGSLSPTKKLFAELRRDFTNELTRACSVLTTPTTEGTRFSLIHSTFYVFNTCGTRWAMDPALRRAGSITDAGEKIADLMRGTEYILITHGHEDHFEPEMISALKELGIKWVIPEFLTDDAIAAGIDRKNIITARAGEKMELGALRVIPFTGRHFRTTNGKGVPELGYLVSAENSPTLLFPGDVRDYNPAGFPDFVREYGIRPDILFSHIWLGDYVANGDSYPYTEDYLRLTLSFGAQRILLCHLYESGRKANGMWRVEHAQMLAREIAARNPSVRTDIPRRGELYHL